MTPIKKTTSMRLRILVSVGLLVFSLLVKQFWPEGTAKLQEHLIPSGMSQTQQAVQTLLTDLETGAPLQAALTDFCIVILESETAN